MLAKAGWWGGDPVAVRKAPADEVLTALEYVEFSAEYERRTLLLNKGEER